MATKTTKKSARIKRHYRVRAKINGTLERPRLSVFKSNRALYLQLIDDINHKTLASSSTTILELDKLNIESATLVAKDLAKKIKALKITEIVFDRSGYRYHGKVKAVAETIRAEGVKI